MPFFSVVLFTKNRSNIVGFAIESVLRQSFVDFELIISDNDDDESTKDSVAHYKDKRIVYHRTSGKLSMVENWECGISLARGKYIICLTDRSALKSCALEKVKKAIDEFDKDVYVWRCNYLANEVGYISFPDGERTCGIVSNSYLFDIFFNQPYAVYGDLLPRGLNSCFSKEILQKIRETTGGIACLPVSPDFTLAFLLLAHCTQIVLINEALFVWGYSQLSNGGSMNVKSDKKARFFRDLGLAEKDAFSEVPLKVMGIHNSICNDFINIKHRFPSLFDNSEIYWPSYFFQCYKEIDQIKRVQGAGYEEKMLHWKKVLQEQEKSVVDEVSTLIKRDNFDKSMIRKIQRKVACLYGRMNKSQVRDSEMVKPDKFVNIMEAVKWIEVFDGVEKI